MRDNDIGLLHDFSGEIKMESIQNNLLYQNQKGATVYLIGPIKLQNELIARYLEKENGNSCIVLENFSQLPKKHHSPCNKPNLFLWDCYGEELKRLLTEITMYKSSNESNIRFILFNVPNNIEFKKAFVLKGIHGFFYRHDSLDTFLKGVRTVLDGKLWLSRDVMTKCIFEDDDSDLLSKRTYGNLTERQIEILAMIAVGSTNCEISDKLCISLNTVKTHLYKIFKEINVPNRLQASLWAAKNL